MKKQYWILLMLLFSAICLTADVLNNKFDLVDFEVYYRTAKRMLNGEALYRIAGDGHYVYKYAPAAAILFIPWTFFSFAVSKYLFWIFSTGLLIIGLRTLYCMCRINAQKKEHNNILILFSFLTVAVHIQLDWHLGQVNILLLYLYIAAMHAFLYDEAKRLALLLAVSLFIKPFALIFIPYLLFKKRISAIGYTLLFTFLIGLLPFIFYPSWKLFYDLHTAWFNELSIEMASKQHLLADKNHSIFSVLARITPLSNWLDSADSQQLYQFILLSIMGIVFLQYIKKGQYLLNAYVGEMAVLCSWIPLLAYSSQNAYLLTLPLVMHLLVSYHKLSTVFKIIMVLACILIGINIYDLLGKATFQYLLNHSIYVYGAFLLGLCAFRLRWDAAKQARLNIKGV